MNKGKKFLKYSSNCWTKGAIPLLLASWPSLGDVYHYNNVIPGDRAIGFGGAYTGLSEDASGVVYNPGGLAFATLSEISGSANAFYKSKITYKKAIGEDDFVEEADGNVAPFFGGLYNLDDKISGLIAAFGIYSTDTVVKNQNDLIAERPLLGETIVRFHRTVHETASTNISAGALAKRWGPFGFGLALGYLSVAELHQSYQDSEISTTSNGQKVSSLTLQADRRQFEVGGLEPVLGIKWKNQGQWLGIGLSLRKAWILSQQYQRDLEKSEGLVDSKHVVQKNNDDLPGIRRTLERRQDETPLETWPAEVRFGLSLQPTRQFTWAFDVAHRTKAKAHEPTFQRQAVTNFHTGIEYRVADIVPIRFGIFTNKDSRPRLKEEETNQLDHINYTGVNLFGAYTNKESTFSAGLINQSGSGKAQKLGSGSLQNVSARITTFAFAITHHLTGQEDRKKCEDIMKEEKNKKK